METGSRIRLLRVFSGLNQADIGEVVGLSQKTIAMVEAGKRSASSHLIGVLSEFFGYSESWLKAGHRPAFGEGWRYYELPSKGVSGKSETYSPAKKLRVLDEVIRGEFVEFLAENRIFRYYEGLVEGDEDRFCVFAISPSSTLICRIDYRLWPSMAYATGQLEMQKIKSIPITGELSSGIYAPEDGRTAFEKVIELHRCLGLETLCKGWEKWFHAHRGTKVQSRLHIKNIKKVAKEIIRFHIRPADLLEALPPYCKTADDLETLRQWETWGDSKAQES